jgi:hypothetical protein
MLEINLYPIVNLSRASPISGRVLCMLKMIYVDFAKIKLVMGVGLGSWRI